MKGFIEDCWDAIIVSIIFATIVALLLIGGFLAMGRRF